MSVPQDAGGVPPNYYRELNQPLLDLMPVDMRLLAGDLTYVVPVAKAFPSRCHSERSEESGTFRRLRDPSLRSG